MPRKRPIGPFSRAPALATLDGRSREGRMLKSVRTELMRHVGPNPSATQTAMVDRAAWLSLHVAMMDAKTLASAGMPNEGDSRQYLAWTNTLTRLLRDLGTRGGASKPPSVADAIAAAKARRTAPA